MREGGPEARQPRSLEAADGNGHLPLRFDPDRRRSKPKVRRWWMTRRAEDIREIADAIDLWEARKRLRVLAYFALTVLGAL